MKELGVKQFGGDWSDAKLDALRRYIAAYSQALSKFSFERIYIDAFAGAGIITPEPTNPEQSLFEENLADEEAKYRHGSPLIALEADPGFHRFIFIERNAQSIDQLREQVSSRFPEKMAKSSFHQGDANLQLQTLTQQNWKAQRAVAFLDPFALQVSWKTIEMIAKTQAIDMWLLFPAMAVNRMLPKSGVVPAQWAEKLTETFGTQDWSNYFFSGEEDLFGEIIVSKQPKIFEELSNFITERLKTVFADANSKPLILKNSTGAPLFLLCFASGNPKGAPIAVRIANHIINLKSHGH
mgnify:CR=1 FL=1